MLNIRLLQTFISSALFAGLCLATSSAMSQASSLINHTVWLDRTKTTELANSVRPEVEEPGVPTVPLKPSLKLTYLKLIPPDPDTGLSGADILQLKSWLVECDFPPESIHIQPGNKALVFSGTVAEANGCFNANMVNLTVNGVTHFANKNKLKIPVAVAPAVKKIIGLNDFMTDKEKFAAVIDATIPFIHDVEKCAQDLKSLVACGSGNRTGEVAPAIIGQTDGYLGDLVVAYNGTITATANKNIPKTPTYILTPTLVRSDPLIIQWTVGGTCLYYSLCDK